MSRMSIFSLVLLLVTISVPAGSDDWPCFRGPAGNGVSQDTRIPAAWSPTKNLKWKLKLPGAGFSSPIVVGGHVYVTCYSNTDDLDKLKRHLVCVDRRTGKQVWATVIPSTATEQPERGFNNSHGYASHTPVSDGKRIYVLCGNSGSAIRMSEAHKREVPVT